MVDKKTGMRIFRFVPGFRFFGCKNFGVLKKFFGPFWGVFAQIHGLYQVFSPLSGFSMTTDSHACKNNALNRIIFCFFLHFCPTFFLPQNFNIFLTTKKTPQANELIE